MTPKNKAAELVEKFYQEIDDIIGRASSESIKQMGAKQCVKICVEEILSLRMINVMGRGNDETLNEGEYYQKVLKEIESL